MQKILYIFYFLFFMTAAKADEYYCWSISGLNIRDTPSPNGNIIGKLEYGQKVEFDSKAQIDYEYYEDLFLIGVKDDNSADIKFRGWWLKIELNGRIGYVFSGYLSKYPHFLIEKREDQLLFESFEKYMIRNYKLLNYDTAVWSSNIYDNEVRSYSWDYGITVINDHNEKGASLNIIFAEMTLNEALLFVKFHFHILNRIDPDERSKLESSQHYYGLMASYDKCEINFPAPDGMITILQVGRSIVITYYGSC